MSEILPPPKENVEASSEAEILQLKYLPPLKVEGDRAFDENGKPLERRPDGLYIVENGEWYVGKFGSKWRSIRQRTFADLDGKEAAFLRWVEYGAEELPGTIEFFGKITVWFRKDGGVKGLQIKSKEWKFDPKEADYIKRYTLKVKSGVDILNKALKIVENDESIPAGEEDIASLLRQILDSEERNDPDYKAAKLLEKLGDDTPTPVCTMASRIVDNPYGLPIEARLTELQLIRLSRKGYSKGVHVKIGAPKAPEEKVDEDLSNLIKQTLELTEDQND